jgi:hypothetical protein
MANRNQVTESRETAAALFAAWLRQRPGLDPGLYCTPNDHGQGWKAYRADAHMVTQQMHRGEKALCEFRRRTYQPEVLADALAYSFAGRLSMFKSEKGYYLDYTPGQFYSTEFRQAAAIVLETYLGMLTMAEKGLRIA